MPMKLPSFRRQQPSVVHSFDEDDSIYLEQESPSTKPVAVVSFRKPKQQRSSIPQGQELVGEGAKAMYLSPERASRSILIPEVNLWARNKMQRNETRSSIDVKVDDLLAMITSKGDVPTLKGSQSPIVSPVKIFRSFQGSAKASLPPAPPRRAVSLGNQTKSSTSTIIGTSNRRRGGVPMRSPALERRILRCQGGRLSSPTTTMVDLPIDALSFHDDAIDERYLSASSSHHKSTSSQRGGDVALRRRLKHHHSPEVLVTTQVLSRHSRGSSSTEVVPPPPIEALASPGSKTRKKIRSSLVRQTPRTPPRRRAPVDPTEVVRRRGRRRDRSVDAASTAAHASASTPSTTTKTAATSKSPPRHPLSSTQNMSSSPRLKCKQGDHIFRTSRRVGSSRHRRKQDKIRTSSTWILTHIMIPPARNRCSP